jgi:hypothetical protein
MTSQMEVQTIDMAWPDEDQPDAPMPDWHYEEPSSERTRHIFEPLNPEKTQGAWLKSAREGLPASYGLPPYPELSAAELVQLAY